VKDLKETLNNLPHTKTFIFIEDYFKAYENLSKKESTFVISKYYENDYIKLLKKKMSREQLGKELDKMLPRTSWGVNRIMMEIAVDLAEMTNYLNK